MKLLCLVSLVVLAQQALTKPQRRVELNPPIIPYGQPKNTKEIPKGGIGKPEGITKKTPVLEPWNENAAPLDDQTLLNPNAEHILLEIESTQVYKTKDQVVITEETEKMELRERATSEVFKYPHNGGNYRNNLQLTWKISSDIPVKITFVRFDLELNYDFLYIRDGLSSDSPLLGKFTGEDLPSPVVTTQNTFSIMFTSDRSQTGKGFEIRIEATTTSVTTSAIPTTTTTTTTTRVTTTTLAPTTATRVCTDEYPESSCQSWANTRNYCVEGPYISWMAENCKKSCDLCNDDTTTSATISPTTCQCGVANTARIVGGTEVNPKRKYPWQVGLRKPHPNPDKYTNYISCGGTIINDRWILTAAHCIVDKDTCEYNYDPDTKILVGDHHQFHQTDDVSDTKQYSIKSFIRHPSYSCDSLDYDFALLELAEAIPFNSVIRPICLPEDDSQTYIGRTGTVTGWGYTNNEGDLSKFLQEVQVPILANDQCGNYYPKPAAMKMCAGGEVGKDSCGGDSGGPMHVVENNKYVQVGVVSYGHKVGCASTEYPGVYARVSKVLQWITETSSNGNKCD